MSLPRGIRSISRSAVDATRFTAATPHVYANPTSARPPKSTSTSTYSSLRQSPHLAAAAAEPGMEIPQRRETPQEKVARLRAQRIAEREVELPLPERVVMRGRRLADKAHRIVIYTLVGSSVLFVLVSGFSVADMLMYNRRRRNAYYEQQHRIYASKLVAAIETEKAGLPLRNDQLIVINRERLARAEAERLRESSWWRKSKHAVYSFFTKGLKQHDDFRMIQERFGDPVLDGGRIPTEREVLELIGLDEMTLLQESRARMGEKSEHDYKRKELEEDTAKQREEVSKGGLLDHLGSNVASVFSRGEQK